MIRPFGSLFFCAALAVIVALDQGAVVLIALEFVYGDPRYTPVAVRQNSPSSVRFPSRAEWSDVDVERMEDAPAASLNLASTLL